MAMLRSSWVEIDLAALRHNVALVRDRVGPEVRIVAVVKSDGFGCGAARTGQAAIAGGADAVAVGDPRDVQAIRGAGVEAPILLYASTLPEAAAEVAALGATVTIHDAASLEAFAALNRPLDAYMKVETGLGRLGVNPDEWAGAFAAVDQARGLRLTGIYTHLNAPEDPDAIKRQIAAFQDACRAAEAAGLKDFTRMVASSHVVLGYPELDYDAVNTGRLLFGLVEGAWSGMAPARPVIAAVKSRVIQVKEFPAGSYVGFLGGGSLEQPTRLAVLPIGFGDGFNHQPPLGEALIEGRRAPVVGRRGIEHTVIDVSGVPDVRIGSETVFLGPQGADRIDGAELAGWLGLPQFELLPRLARTLPRVYLD
ncbi:MAG: alanine racemase [Alphaproteobacteria bacterium]|jgi:alanine racemase|nr:alanine racemase [Alphaproteobacteria bacterium]MDP6815616.1 alanine racemase [Alphaproteobacteria bacterium]